MGDKTKVVILAGGKGTRLREETEVKPKAMVEIGGKPILWHIMNIYSHYGFKDFVICLGYKGEVIKEYFINRSWMENDFLLNTSKKGEFSILSKNSAEDWNITFADTGQENQTGGRIKKIEKYIDEDNFFATYCDVLSDVDMNKLFAYHKKMGKTATLTAIHPRSPFGVIEIKDGIINSFKEKPRLEGNINGGFFAFKKDIFDVLDENSILEEEPLRALAQKGKLAAYEHQKFWMSMDTFKDVGVLNDMWDKNDRPWAVWK